MRSLWLFLPSSLPHAADELAALPGLARIVSRSKATIVAGRNLESVLLESFGVQRQRDWPVAPFGWVGEAGEPGQRYWLRADPVHLRAERDALLLVDARHFPLDAESAEALVQALNAHFESDGMQFFAPAATRWYVAVDQMPEIATASLRAATGRSIDPLLPAGADALAWHRHFNEIQMLFHSHPVNELRETAGHPTVNSVWFWGGGAISAAMPNAFSGVWANDPVARGLALVSGVGWAPLPSSAKQWLSQANQGQHLLMLDHTGPGNPIDRQERDWFVPLLGALRDRQLARLTLLAARGEETLRLELSAGDLWKFWRRAPELAH